MAHIEQDNDFDLDEEASEETETELQDLINEINAGDNDSENEDEDENLTNLPGFTEEMLSFEVFIKEEEIDKIEPLYLK